MSNLNKTETPNNGSVNELINDVDLNDNDFDLFDVSDAESDKEEAPAKKVKLDEKFSAKPKERGIFKDGFESEQVVNYSASNDLLPQTDENKNVDEEEKSPN